MQVSGRASSGCFDSLATFFGELGITAQGLETAAQGSPLVGPLIGPHLPASACCPACEF